MKDEKNKNSYSVLSFLSPLSFVCGEPCSTACREMKLGLWSFALLAAALPFMFNGCKGQRSPELPPIAFKVEFGAHKIPTEMIAGQQTSADVTVKNVSERSWPSKPNQKGKNAVRLSYHWLDRKGRIIVFEGLRTALPRDLGPGESARLHAAIQAPEKAGKYVLDVTLVQEGVAWFPEMNGAKLSLPINVMTAKSAERSAAPRSASQTKCRGGRKTDASCR